MIKTYVLEHLIEVDEWVSQRKNYSYTLSVNQYGYSFWIYNQKTDKGQSFQSIEEINESKLESEDVCETLEVQR